MDEPAKAPPDTETRQREFDQWKRWVDANPPDTAIPFGPLFRLTVMPFCEFVRWPFLAFSGALGREPEPDAPRRHGHTNRVSGRTSR